MSTMASLPEAKRDQRSLIVQNKYMLLGGVSWQQYSELRESPENRGVRMYYSEGDLLLMTTGHPHERIRTVLTLMLHVWCVENEVPVMCFGQWTLQNPTAHKGLESDNCFYVTNLPRVEGKRDLDLAVDPPPDFALEIDITTDSQLKFGIYAAIGVSEIWIWEGSEIVVYRLIGTEYVRNDASIEFPDFPLELASSMILDQAFQADTTVMKNFGEAIRK